MPGHMSTQDKICSEKSSDISRNLYCSIVFWLGHLSDQTGICTGQNQKYLDVQLLFHALVTPAISVLHKVASKMQILNHITHYTVYTVGYTL